MLIDSAETLYGYSHMPKGRLQFEVRLQYSIQKHVCPAEFRKNGSPKT